jgi:hypothetical protein
VNRLKIIREKKSLTLAQLSARTSIPVRLLGDYEENRQEIPPAHIKSLAKALWVKPDELIAPGVAVAPGGGPPPVSAVDAPPAPPAPVTAAPSPVAPPAPLPPAPYPEGTRPAPVPQAPAPGGTYPVPPPRQPYPPARPARPLGGPPGGDRGGRPAGGGRPKREPVMMPATEGQVTEIMRLAARLNLSTAQLEAQFGRPLSEVTRFDAREWIKRLREDAAAKAPPSKIHFGQWPGLKDDLEAVYLRDQKESGAPFDFALFNGEVIKGAIIDFTPYTITIAEDGTDNHVVLRKLAIAYYRRLGPGGDGAAAGEETSPNGREAEAVDRAPFEGPAQPQFHAPPASADGEEPAESGGPA